MNIFYSLKTLNECTKLTAWPGSFFIEWWKRKWEIFTWMMCEKCHRRESWNMRLNLIANGSKLLFYRSPSFCVTRFHNNADMIWKFQCILKSRWFIFVWNKPQRTMLQFIAGYYRLLSIVSNNKHQKFSAIQFNQEQGQKFHDFNWHLYKTSKTSLVYTLSLAFRLPNIKQNIGICFII